MSSHPIQCPKCNSMNCKFIKERELNLCEDCGEEFVPKRKFISQHIFLSYGHDKHDTLAKRIRDDLRSRGHELWFDEERLKPGYDWEDFIEKGIEDLAAHKPNSVMLLLLTPHAVRRPDGYCLNEVARALGRGIRIIPIMVLKSEPPLSICRIQWLDMTECIPIHEKETVYQPRYQRLISAIEEGQLDFEGVQQRLFKTLRPLEFEADILQYTQKFSGRRWLFDDVRIWLEKSDRRVFWICGGPGTGKSSISAALSSRHVEVAALHFCKFGHAQKGDPKEVVKSIVYQLSTQLHDYESILVMMNLEELIIDDALTLFDNLLVQPLSRLNAPAHAVVILIDGIDEASIDGYNALAKFIAEQFEKTPQWLRLIITSRPEETVTGPLVKYKPYYLDTETDVNRSDIREYLQQELAAVLKGRSDKDQVMERILDLSEGLFLYVEWVCRDINQGMLSIDHLDAFPTGMGGVFRSFFDRLVWDRTAVSPRPDYLKFQKSFLPVLRAILAAQQPLSLKFLKKLLGWKEEEVFDFIRSLGALFILTQEAGTDVIIPYHKSIMEWLTNQTTAKEYYVSIREGHVSLSQFGIQLFISGRQDAIPYFNSHLPYHLEAAGDLDDLLDDTTATLAPEHKASMVFQLAEFCRKNSYAVLARHMHEYALVIRKKCFGINHPLIAASLHEIGESFHDQHEYGQAEKYYLMAIAMLEKCKPGDEIERGNCLNDLGALRSEQFNPKEALSLYVKALKIFISNLGEHHEDTISVKHNIALIESGFGNHTEAIRLCTEAVDYFRKDPIKKYAKLVTSLNSLISIYSLVGKMDMVIELKAELLLVKIAKDPLSSLHMVSEVVDLAVKLSSGANKELQEKLLQNALMLLANSSRHPDREVVRLSTHCALKLVNNKMSAHGIPFAKHAVNQSKRVFGPQSVQTADALNAHVRCLQEGNEDQEAIPIAREALDIYTRTYGPDSIELSSLLNNLGLSLVKCDFLEEAEQNLQHAVKNNPISSYPHYWLAKLYQKLKKDKSEAFEWQKYLQLGPTSEERGGEARARLQFLRSKN